jgi:Condensation domain
MNHSSRPTTVVRRLGALEHIFWLKDQHMPYHFAVCAEISGPTTVEAWRAAFDLVQRRHPNLRAGIEVGQDRVPCFHQVAGAPIPVRLAAAGDLRWEREMERELATPFDTRQAPLVRAVLLHHAQRAALILSAHHSIADTKSLVFTIRDALQALSGKVLDPLPPSTSLDALPEPLQEKGQDESLDRMLAPALSGQQDVYREPDGSLPRIRALALTPALTSALRRWSRTEETTVHGALVAAAVEAARQLSSDLRAATITVCSAIDFRKALGAGEDVALLSGGTFFPVEPRTRSFWDMARLAKRSIAPMQSPEAASLRMKELDQFLANRPDENETAARMSGIKFDINISNLGNLPIETRFGDLTLERLWGPSILAGFEGEQEIGVATINGSLSLLHTSYKPLPSLLELMEELLGAACL